MAHITPALFRFLADLREHNDRDWFAGQKSRYESDVLAPAMAFITAMGPELKAISPHFEAIAKRQGGSMFRIYRDTRFSKDKSPYKDHVGLHFRHAQSSRDVHAPGFYLHLAPGDVSVGAGMWQPDNATLGHVRDQIVADPDGWTSVSKAMAEANLAFFGDSLKRPPRGYDADHVHVDDLKRKSFAVMTSLEEAQVTGEEQVQQVAAIFGRSAPLVRFLCASQGLPFE